MFFIAQPLSRHTLLLLLHLSALSSPASGINEGADSDAAELAGLNECNRAFVKLVDEYFPDATKQRIQDRALTPEEANGFVTAIHHDPGTHRDIVALADLYGKNLVAKGLLSATNIDSLETAVNALDEVKTLADATKADAVLGSLANLMPLYYGLRYSPALSPEERHHYANDHYMGMVNHYHRRNAEVISVRMDHAFKQEDPGLNDTSKYSASVQGNPRHIPLVLNAYARTFSERGPGKLLEQIQFLRTHYRHAVYSFEGTDPNEVDERMRMEAEIALLKRTLEQLPRTQEVEQSIALLAETTLPLDNAKTAAAIMRMKQDPNLRESQASELANWDRQISSDDPILRADVSRKVTHFIWRVQYMAEMGSAQQQKEYREMLNRPVPGRN
jgi:hypothetical protein